jgi:hypothetical protein
MIRKSVIPESRDVLKEKLAYKEKMLLYYKNELSCISVNRKCNSVCSSDDTLDAFMEANNVNMNNMKDKVSLFIFKEFLNIDDS